MRKNYRNSVVINNILDNVGPPHFPGRVIREGTIGDCPQCKSTTSYGYFGQITRLFGAKKYCINDNCIYHYIDIRKDDVKIETRSHFLSFIKSREREFKLNQIL